MTDAFERLLNHARAARERAYAPYSGFQVGAALETADGAVFSGCNVENASYGLTLCAERSALAAAVASGHRSFTRIVVSTSAGPPASPCGLCRQALAEFAPGLSVRSESPEGTADWSLATLLPAPFRLNPAARAFAAVAVLLAGACGYETPTAVEGLTFPVTVVTSEVHLSHDQFASGIQVFGGFGRASDVAVPLVATEFGEDGLEARTLVRFGPIPRSASIRDTAGTTVTDPNLTLVGGRAVLRFDTLAAPSGPVTLSASLISERWHPPSATFVHAVDTLGEQVSWAHPGGGDATPIATAVWDPAESDSAFFAIDTLVIKAWDTEDEARGMLVRMVTPGERVKVRSANLVMDALPSIRSDTMVTTDTFSEYLTFIYDPVPSLPEGTLQIGGAPAWRTVFEVQLPASFPIRGETCPSGECALPLTADGITQAALVLTPGATDPALRPTDTLFVDARPIPSPEFLPRAPLGNSIQIPVLQVPPEIFAGDEGRVLEIPITGFVRDLARGVTEDSVPAPNTLALLAAIEPQSFELMRFLGPDSSSPPLLRILVSQLSGMSMR